MLEAFDSTATIVIYMHIFGCNLGLCSDLEYSFAVTSSYHEEILPSCLTEKEISNSEKAKVSYSIPNQVAILIYIAYMCIYKKATMSTGDTARCWFWVF